MSDKRQICLRCLMPVATAEDAAVWQDICDGLRERPVDWPDDEGSHMCWNEVAKGDCFPGGDRVRVTNGLLVLHNDDMLLATSVEGVVAALREVWPVWRADAPLPDEVHQLRRRVEELEATLILTRETPPGVGSILAALVRHGWKAGNCTWERGDFIVGRHLFFDGPTTPLLLDLCGEVAGLRPDPDLIAPTK